MKTIKTILPVIVLIVMIILVPGRMVYGQAPGVIILPEVELDRLGIDVEEGEAHEFVYSNKKAGYFAGETNSSSGKWHHGWNIYNTEVLEDYELWLGETKLDRKTARVTVYPDRLKRYFPDFSITEEVYFPDDINALIIKVSGPKEMGVGLRPMLHEGWNHKWNKGTGILEFNQPRAEEGTPAWLVISSSPMSEFKPAADESGAKGVLECSRDLARISYTAPGVLTPVKPRKEIFYYLLAASEQTEAWRQIPQLRVDHDRIIRQKKYRLTELLENSMIVTEDREFNKAFMWSLLSMDSLVMDAYGKGIFAGYHWFTQYWGRDTFISLPGACLVTGNFTEAKEILTRFAKWQNTDMSIREAGRIPNQVSENGIIYNTTDGTWWWIYAADQYVRYSGDLKFIEEMYPKVKLAIEGAMKHRVDELGFLTHQGAETWMDAVTNGREWTPRENRAVEVQVLWAYALKTAEKWAERLKLNDESNKWQRDYEKTVTNFKKYFINPDNNILYDHLAKDGTPSKQVRPNQLFAETVPGWYANKRILEMETSVEMIRQTVSKCVLPYGVISIEQDDPLFMPYHYDERYHKDAAYHNGTIWQWLAGPAITAMIRFGGQEKAYELTQNMIDEILRRGALGAIAENKNAILRPGEENLTGTVSQAWSMAEFNRNAFQDYLGIKANLAENYITWAPRNPVSWGNTKAKVKIGEYYYKFYIKSQYNNERITYSYVPVVPPELIKALPEMHLSQYDGHHEFSVRFPESKTISITKTNKDDYLIEYIIEKESDSPKSQNIRSVKDNLEDITFAEPQERKSWPGVERLLKEMHGDLWEVTKDNPEAAVIVDAEDPANDDTGTGAYTYPTNPNYKDGILDLRSFKVKADDDFIYFDLKFTDLIDPGWHPEYGFQLTFASIAIDTDQAAGSGQGEIGRHARYTIPEEYAYEKIIYVGGGLLIEDSSGNQVVKLNPPSRKYKLGDADTDMIHLAIPREYLPGDPKSWAFSVLIGGQDDQGQAGLGNYREVGVTATEWAGGGAEKQSGNSGVYDTLFHKPE